MVMIEEEILEEEELTREGNIDLLIEVSHLHLKVVNLVQDQGQVLYIQVVLANQDDFN